VRGIAADVPLKRASGDERLLGVDAEAYRLASLEECCLFLHLTLPDLTAIDPIVAWVIEEASIVQVGYRSTEIVGLIRRKDVASADRARFREAQVAW
jgi:hypothetical protein